MQRIIVHPRVNRKRPEIEDADAIAAWRNAIAVKQRKYCYPRYYIAAGADNKGRPLEMAAAETDDGGVIIYHAMKLTKSVIAELGL